MIILAINNKDNIGQKEEGKQSLLTKCNKKKIQF
jgi:hypothetical protein